MAMLRYVGRVMRSFSIQSVTVPEENTQLADRLAQMSEIPEILSVLEESELTQLDKLSGLRSIARVVRSSSSQLSQLEDPRYLKMKSELKNSISEYGAQEVSDFCFWLRVMRSLSIRELNPAEVRNLEDKINELCSNKAFSSIQQFALFFDLCSMKRSNLMLCDSLLEILMDPREAVSLSNIKQALIGITKQKEFGFKKIVNSCLARLRQFEDQDFDIADSIMVFKLLAKMGEENENTLLVKVNLNIMRYIKENINALDQSNLFSLLNIYENGATEYKSLLSLIFKRLESILETDNSKDLLVKTLVSLGTVASHPRLRISDSLTNSLNSKIKRQMDELNEDDLSQVIYYGHNLGKEFIDVSFLGKLESFPQISPQNLCMMVKVLYKLSFNYDINSLIKDKEQIVDLFAKQDFHTKFVAFDQISQNNNPEIEYLRAKFLDSMLGYIDNSWKNVNNFAHEMSIIEITNSTHSSLSPIIDETVDFFDNHITSTTAPLIFRRMMHLSAKNWNQWRSFIDKHAHLLNSMIVDLCIREKPQNIRHMNHLLSKITPSHGLLVFASKQFSVDSPTDEMKTFSSILNQHSPDSFHNMNIRSLTPFFLTVQAKGLQKDLKKFLENLHQYLDSLSDFELKKISPRKAATFLAQNSMLDQRIAKKMVQLNESDTDVDSINELISIGSSCTDAFTDLGNFKKSIIDFNKIKTPNLLIDRIKAYLVWPDDTMDEEMLNGAVGVIKRTNPIKIIDLIPLIRLLTKYPMHLHWKFTSSLIQEITNQISENEEKFLAQENVKFLDAFSGFSYFRFSDTYSSILGSIQRNFTRLNSEQKVSVMKSLSRRGLKQPDIIKKFISYTFKYPDYYLNMIIIMKTLSELGYQTEDWALEAFERIMKLTQGNMKIYHEGVFSSFFCGMLMFGAKDQHLNEAIDLYNSREHRVFNFNDCLIHDHFALINTNTHFKPRMSSENKFKLVLPFRTFGLTSNIMNVLKRIFTENNIEFSEFSTVKDVWAPLYIHSKDTVIWPFTIFTHTYNKENLKGPMQMHKRHLEAAASKVLTFDANIITREDELLKWIQSTELIN